MPAKQLVYSDQARQAMKRGMDTLADAVKITLGPRAFASRRSVDVRRRHIVRDTEHESSFAFGVAQARQRLPEREQDVLDQVLPEVEVTLTIAA